MNSKISKCCQNFVYNYDDVFSSSFCNFLRQSATLSDDDDDDEYHYDYNDDIDSDMDSFEEFVYEKQLKASVHSHWIYAKKGYVYQKFVHMIDPRKMALILNDCGETFGRLPFELLEYILKFCNEKGSWCEYCLRQHVCDKDCKQVFGMWLDYNYPYMDFHFCGKCAADVAELHKDMKFSWTLCSMPIVFHPMEILQHVCYTHDKEYWVYQLAKKEKDNMIDI